MLRAVRGRWLGFARPIAAPAIAALLVSAIGIPTTNASPSRSPKKPRSINLITVNSLARDLEGLSAADKSINLARAIALAGQDPSDNEIRFDPELFTGAQTIVLDQPITVNAAAGNMSIRGPESGSLTIDGGACPDASIILGNNGSLALFDLTVKGGRQRAILLKDKARVTLENVHVHSKQGPGMALFGSARAEVTNCIFKNIQTHGIEVHGDCVALLDHVVVEGSGQSSIAGFDRASITAESSTLNSNGHWNLVLTGECRAKLENSKLTGAQFANADISENSRLDIRGCTIEQGGRFGVFATGRTSCEIAQSTIRLQGNRGIEMQDQASLRVSSSEIDANGDYGLILFEKCHVRAVDTKFTRNAGHGVSVRGKSAGDFDRCVFIGNRYSGIGCLDAGDGGDVRATQCVFRNNGMRPIYRGPLHLDPLVPTPLSIDALTVECIADPRATIELYLDRAGEAARYLRTIRADTRGRFLVNRSEVPPGWVMTATATAGNSTSEFNVIAGEASSDVIGALLARTGPLSDTGGHVDLDGGLRRWQTGTQLVLHLPNPPSQAVEKYAHFIARHVPDWTCGAIRAEVCLNATAPSDRNTVVVPVQYLPPDSTPLLGRGGVTFMRWDAQGYFVVPMKILLASGKDPAETCPRVLAHEFGHVLGLCHTRVGLLSRMQGSTPPTEAFVNDFSPMFTFYDVLALHTLHSSQLSTPATLRQVAAASTLPPRSATEVVSIRSSNTDNPTYSPSPADHQTQAPKRAKRP